MHIIFCIANHFEPKSEAVIEKWVTEYPKLASRFIDADGQHPKHTFFYPIEQYDEKRIDRLSGLCDEGYGEIETHLHHDNDTSEKLIQAGMIPAKIPYLPQRRHNKYLPGIDLNLRWKQLYN